MSDFIILADGDTRHAVAALASFSSNGLVSQVHIAGDGYEALDFLFSQRGIDKRNGGQPSLILLDLGLPITGGLHVLRTVKTDPRSATIPVVVFASSASDLDIHAAIKLGADSVIEKPLTFHKLLLTATRLGVPLAGKDTVSRRVTGWADRDSKNPWPSDSNDITFDEDQFRDIPE